ncbi:MULTISPECIES: NAD(P)/FAD-dependent oxidoreductase [unclassified Actinotalea]|uniref:NAD(P)/FAD-dependent oxidoreductase n=1 Tax=unclassified Actinotalea TaxID=2638618 RepID=UPI0015F67FE5|nr:MULTISPECIES: NAD(P)/FAD-dependent oxidoreductase [unclassified Actinotalea]
MSVTDVVVVGAGPAGLSAALLLGRSRRSVVVVDAGEPRNAAAGHVQGFLTRDGVPPAELLSLGVEEVRRYGVEVRHGRVVDVTPIPPGAAETSRARVTVELDDGTSLAARRVVLATGLRDELPAVPGLSDRWGRDVLHCPYCHGWEVREAAVGVLVDRPEDAVKAFTMTQWTDAVTVVLHGVDPDDVEPAVRRRLDALDIPVLPGPVTALVLEDDALVAVRTPAGEVRLGALVVQPRLVASDALLTALGAHVQAGPSGHTVVAEPDGRTGVPHVFAAGNVTDPSSQVVMAAAAGYRTALAVDHDLIDEDVEAAVRRSAAGGHDDAPGAQPEG